MIEQIVVAISKNPGFWLGVLYIVFLATYPKNKT